MKRPVIIALLLPGLAFAGTDCRVIEYAERYEAVCIGDEMAGPRKVQSVAASPVAAPPAGEPDPKEKPVAAEHSASGTRTAIRTTPATLTDLERRQHRPTRELREAARASRKKLMMEGRNEPVSPQRLKNERSGT